MSEARKYFYLKLKDNFFDSDEIIVLENMKDGYLYENILLKLYLRSLKREGKLMFNDAIPYSAQMLASITRHSEGDIKQAISIFKNLGLVEILDDGAIFMTNIQNFIGGSSTEADRIRNYRARIKKEKQLKDPENTDLYICTPKIELELKKELKIDKDKSGKPDNSSSIKNKRLEIAKKAIDYLNNVSKHHYHSQDKKNTGKIIKLLETGYSPENIKSVIDMTIQNWSGDKYKRLIRPETIFNGKFGSKLEGTYKWHFLDDDSVIKKETLLDYDNLDNNGKTVSNSEAEHALERLQHEK
ncbi:replication initiation protein [Oenococcus phage vB_OeS_unk162]|nr:replication initiation protein [Oenococcus phage vB_OeS_unk162]